jgi:hypothetical protein
MAAIEEGKGRNAEKLITKMAVEAAVSAAMS